MKKNKVLSKILIATVATVGLISGTSIYTSASTYLYKFDVISDTHIGANDKAIKNTSTALNCIKNCFSNDSCIVVNGDVVDNNKDSSYDTLTKVVDYVDSNKSSPTYNPSDLKGNTDRLPYMYFNFGNHEFRENANWSSDQSKYDWSLSQFATYTRSIQTKLSANGVSYTDRDRDKAYDFQYVHGDRFIFLGSDDVKNGDAAYLNPDYQLDYISGKLNNKLTFMFCHQPIKDTVNGSIAKESIVNSDDVKSMISDKSNVIMFTSHTHNSFDDYLLNEGDNYASVGDSSVFATPAISEEPEGYHVKVYDDKVVVYAVKYLSNDDYDFIDKKTIEY